MFTIAVTGADGFVGRQLCQELVTDGFPVVPVVRDTECAARFASFRIETLPLRIVGDIGETTTWGPALAGVEVVIHLAARVHVMNETVLDPLAAFRAVNTDGTVRLANEAALLGVRRLVYISTVKVNGESTSGRAPFNEQDQPAPADPYGVSKLEAEQKLVAIAGEKSMEWVVVRPPLVHGPQVGGNLDRLLRLVDRGWPLPFGGAGNRRSLIGVKNLASALVLCAHHPSAANKTFLVSDGQDLAMQQMIRTLADGLGRRTPLFPIPVSGLRFLSSLLGKQAVLDRLYGSLQLDISRIRQDLGWCPPVSAVEGLTGMCRWYRQNQRTV